MPAPTVTDSVHYDEQNDELITGEAVALDLRPTGFVLRAAGSAIDLLLYLGSYLLAVVVFISAAVNAGLDEALMTAISVVALVLFIFVAPVTVETLSHGRSLGKLAVGARIVRDDGGSIGLRHAAIRGMLGVLEIFSTLGGGALLVGLFSARAKRLGDLVAGTYSQHERIPHIQTPIYGVPLELVEWSKTADVARMPDGLARRIAQYLAHVHGLSHDTRLRLGRLLAHEASVYVSPLPEADAELFLAAVASLRRDREFAALQLEKRRLEQLRPVLTGLPHRFPERDA